MGFDFSVVHLSDSFARAYPRDSYPELMDKPRIRPYSCLLLETSQDYFICVPFRSNIKHLNAYMFKDSVRSQTKLSGLDYSKSVIIKDTAFLKEDTPAMVDGDEYKEMAKNIYRIVREVSAYVETYVSYIKGDIVLHPREFKRKYGCTTLKYFHQELGLA